MLVGYGRYELGQSPVELWIAGTLSTDRRARGSKPLLHNRDYGPYAINLGRRVRMLVPG
ncbi:MAG: hypothetical protein JWM47_2587 [Acidimicrobiales bacterium]|nr:hypothetical protein [Acidimicrobiales bacterium]